MANGFQGRNWSTSSTVWRALDVLTATERAVLCDRFQLEPQSNNADNVAPMSENTSTFTERLALRKLRRASMLQGLNESDHAVGSWSDSPVGSDRLTPTFRKDWPASFLRQWEAWLGGSGADWWDEA